MAVGTQGQGAFFGISPTTGQPGRLTTTSQFFQQPAPTGFLQSPGFVGQNVTQAQVQSGLGAAGKAIQGASGFAAFLGSPLASVVTFTLGAGLEALGAFFTAGAEKETAERNFKAQMRQLDLQFDALKLQDRQFQEKLGLQKDQFKFLVRQSNEQLGLTRIQLGEQARSTRAGERLARERVGLERKALGIQESLGRRQLGLQAAEALGRGVERGLNIQRAQRAGRL